MRHTEVYFGAYVFIFIIVFKYTLAYIYLVCAYCNPIWGWLRSIILPSSILKWWTISLGCWWGCGHYLCQHTPRWSNPGQEINQLGGIYVSRGMGYDSLHNIHVAIFCLVGFRFLIYLLGGGRKWTSGFWYRRNHLSMGLDNIFLLEMLGESVNCICVYSYLSIGAQSDFF